jgi:hypothetical protein
MKKQVFLMCLTLVVGVSLTGCYKPYQMEKSVVVQPHQTAFLVPLEGNTGDQAKLNSIEAYEQAKVASKRIIIPTRWNQTGRHSWTGEWIPAMEVIIVDRTPVSIQWTAEANTGTTNKNEAIWLESSNSIGFSIPISIIGYIKETDAASFLYHYSRGKLMNVLNTEGRNKVMEVVSEFSNSLPLDQLLKQYEAINDKISEVVMPYFKDRGITITAIGIAGYATYRDSSIAQAIDGVFANQQTQAVELAKSLAAKKHQEVMELEGQADAAKARETSKGPSMAKQVTSDAEREAKAMIGQAQGEAISVLNGALQKAAQSNLFLKNMALEVESQRIEKWDGQVPAIMTDGSDFVPRNLSSQNR